MRILYFDPILGTSGDMILASLIDLGMPVKYLREKLDYIKGVKIKVSRVVRNGVSARHLDFDIKNRIKESQFIPLIKKSRLSNHVKEKAFEIIEHIFSVEKKVHRAKDLHLHELADADTLLDITGALVAVEYFDVSAVYTKSLKAGRGFIKTQEGNMPAFNFATAELLKGFPIEFMDVPAELTTPTGAAILGHIAKPDEDLVLSKMIKVGMGAGTMKIKDYPNLMRVFLGEISRDIIDECTVIETNIDDMNPQYYDTVFEKLYGAGALEVFLMGTIMKNSRPGILLTVLTKNNIEEILDIIFRETTTLGIRTRKTKRVVLPRKTIKLPSPYGKIRVKLTKYRAKKRFSLEYRDIKKIAGKYNIPLIEMRNKLTRYIENKLSEFDI
jgi:uncharacterized protein (TIGR00299 family) protein